MAPVGHGEASYHRSPWCDSNTCNRANRKCTGLEAVIGAQNQESTYEFRLLRGPVQVTREEKVDRLATRLLGPDG